MGRKRVRKSLEVGNDAVKGACRLAVAAATLATTAASAQMVTVTPSVDTRLTWTDNANASADKEQDFIAEVSPGISISRESGRVNGRLSAQLRNVGYANDSGRNTSFVALQGRGEVEALEDLLFVDLDASISRNNLSAFTGRSSTDTLNTDKNDETRTWSIAPRMQFHIGEAQGSVGYVSRWLDSGGSMGQQRLSQWTAQASSPSAFRLFGWGLNYSRTASDYGSQTTSSGSNNVTSEVGRATLYVNLTPQFRLRAIGGRESNDYEDRKGESGTIYGGGFDWNPTERTTIAVTTEERMFGRGYDLRFNHRTPRSTWHLSFVKDLSSSLQSLGQRPLTQEELLCAQIANVLSKDPVQQQQIYQSCLGILGFDPIAARRTMLSNAQYVDKSFEAGFSLIGVRNTLSFTFVRSDRSRLGGGTGLTVGDDFANTDRVITTSGTVALSHQLSGTTSLNASVTQSRSQGDSGTNLDTKRLFASFGVTTELGPKTYGGLTYRYQRGDSNSADGDFTENAITANLGMRF